MAALKQIHDIGTVDAAQALLRQHLARPPGIFDPHAAFAALEHLVEVARDKADERGPRFSVVLRQTRPLLTNPAFHYLLLKLVGDKEEVLVAKEIQKVLKSAPREQNAWGPPAHGVPRFVLTVAAGAMLLLPVTPLFAVARLAESAFNLRCLEVLPFVYSRLFSLSHFALLLILPLCITGYLSLSFLRWFSFVSVITSTGY